LTVVVVLAAGTYAWSQAKNASLAPPTPSPSPTSTVPVVPAQFLAISVQGAAQPLLAVIGTGSGGRKPSAVAIPINLTLVVPGSGELTAKAVSQLPASSMRLALSNLVGAWSIHYVVTDLDLLATLVDRIGGLNANLSQIVVLPSGGLGPGPVTLDGAQVRAMLSLPGADVQGAWSAVLTALLAHPPTLVRKDVDQSDSLISVQQLLDQAAGAGVLAMPTTVVGGGSTTVASLPDLDTLMSKSFGTTAPTPVIVQNGSGFAGVGETVADLLVPAGFRVVVSENATTFNHPHTTIIANGKDKVEAARAVKRALGVGRVRLSRVPSGVGDVTIVVGKDFKA
jgi:LytR cell envelope-related transcriptional attenuator